MDKPDTPKTDADSTPDAKAETGTANDAKAEAPQPAPEAIPDAAPDGKSAVFPQLDTEETLNALTALQPEGAGTGINAMLNVGLDVQIVLGQARMPISRLLELTRGSIVELNRKIGAPVDLMVSDRLIARGDLVKVGEDRLGVSLTQIVKDYVAD